MLFSFKINKLRKIEHIVKVQKLNSVEILKNALSDFIKDVSL